jgi:hypothetical protein
MVLYPKARRQRRRRSVVAATVVSICGVGTLVFSTRPSLSIAMSEYDVGSGFNFSAQFVNPEGAFSFPKSLVARTAYQHLQVNTGQLPPIATSQVFKSANHPGPLEELVVTHSPLCIDGNSQVFAATDRALDCWSWSHEEQISDSRCREFLNMSVSSNGLRQNVYRSDRSNADSRGGTTVTARRYTPSDEPFALRNVGSIAQLYSEGQITLEANSTIVLIHMQQSDISISKAAMRLLFAFSVLCRGAQTFGLGVDRATRDFSAGFPSWRKPPTIVVLAPPKIQAYFQPRDGNSSYVFHGGLAHALFRKHGIPVVVSETLSQLIGQIDVSELAPEETQYPVCFSSAVSLGTYLNRFAFYDSEMAHVLNEPSLPFPLSSDALDLRKQVFYPLAPPKMEHRLIYIARPSSSVDSFSHVAERTFRQLLERVVKSTGASLSVMEIGDDALEAPSVRSPPYILLLTHLCGTFLCTYVYLTYIV